jgi:hypothetical protein
MKKILLLAGCALGLLSVRPAMAQYYITSFTNAGRNPGSLNSDTEETSQAGWTRILFGLNSMTTTPVWTPTQAVPFAFQFNGQAVISYKVASSGVLTFDTTAVAVPNGSNTALPAAQIPDKSVCVWGLGARSGDYIVTKTFGTAPNRQHWVQFNNYSEGTNTNVVYTYWAIVLEETTNKIYVVDQRTGYNNLTPALSLTVGVQVNATTAEQLATSPNANTTTTYTDDDSPADNTYYSFTPGPRPLYDVALRALSLPAVASRQTPIAVTGTLENLGAQTLTSYNVSYQVGNAPAVTGAVSGASVATLGAASFTHPTGWQPAANGRYSLKVWLSNPNGQTDLDHSNDTLRATVLVGDSTMRRLVVEECFTSATCPPCLPGNRQIEAVNHANPGKQVVIKYQQNFPAPGNDPYYTAEGGARRGYYGINAIPYMTIDGGWNDNSNSFTAAVLNSFQDKPAVMRIKGAYTLGRSGTVAAAATIRPFFDVPAGRLVAHMVITERRTVNNIRTNSETEFFQVMKKMLPNQNGTPVPALTSGQNFNLNQSFNMTTLPTTQAVEHFDSLRVVVFVQDLVTKEVYQGAYMTLSTSLGTHTAQSGSIFELAPNPTTGRTILSTTLARPETVRVDVLDALGRNVLSRPQVALGSGAQEVALDLVHQAAGLYTVRLTTSEGVRTSKLMLE